MVGLVIMSLVAIVTTAWGQYWYDRARRLSDALQYLIEEEFESEDEEVA